MAMEDRPLLDMSVDKYVFFTERVPEIIDRISGEEQAQWGLMKVQHMIEHLIFPLKFATGELKLPSVTAPEKIEKQKAFLMSPYGMPKNFKMPFLPADAPPPLMASSLEESKALLLNTLTTFIETIDAPDFTTVVHPVFGEIGREEWLTFQYKHFYHHFEQFGLL